MRSIGKTMRNSLPALGLGVISAVGVVALAAPLAFAQAKASSEEFANAITDASKLVKEKNCNAAMPKIDQAISLGKGVSEKSPAAGMRVYCYQLLNNQAKVIEAIEQHRQIG